jgi:hypothetical protein
MTSTSMAACGQWVQIERTQARVWRILPYAGIRTDTNGDKTSGKRIDANTASTSPCFTGASVSGSRWMLF